MACGCDDWAYPCCDVTQGNDQCCNHGLVRPWTWEGEIRETESCKDIGDDVDLRKMAIVASEYLYQATCERFPGTEKITVVPAMQPSRFRCLCSERNVREDCGEMCEVLLSPGPVCKIDQVWIQGREMHSGFEVHNGNKLVNTSGCCWPTCNCDGPKYDAGTFSVTYTYGKEPPEMGRMAAAMLAAELAQYASCGKCKIAGVVDLAEGDRRARIAMPVVDMFVDEFGCADKKPLQFVWSPEIADREPRRITYMPGR